MNVKTLFVILNQDRYDYHDYVSNCDEIICFYDDTGRVPNQSTLPDNVRVTQSITRLSFDYITDQLKEVANNYQHICFVCTEEKYFMLAAQLREYFNSTGINFETSKFFRDKIYMKSQVKKMGFRVPNYCFLTSDICYDDVTSYLQTNCFIIKPIDGHGARDTYLVTTESEFKQLSLANIDAYEAEEYVDGHLYHIDSVLHNGEVLYAVPFEYSYPCIEYKSGKVISSFELEESNPLFVKLMKYNETLLENIGGTHVTQLEVFVKGQDFIFLEIAGRPPGGGLVPLHRITNGVDFAEIAVRIQMQPNFLPKINSRRLKYGTFFMVPAPNLKTIRGVHEPLLKSDIDVSYVKLGIGDVSTVADSVSQNGAFYLVSSDNPEHVKADFQMFKNHQFFS